MPSDISPARRGLFILNQIRYEQNLCQCSQASKDIDGTFCVFLFFLFFFFFVFPSIAQLRNKSFYDLAASFSQNVCLVYKWRTKSENGYQIGRDISPDIRPDIK